MIEVFDRRTRPTCVGASPNLSSSTSWCQKRSWSFPSLARAQKVPSSPDKWRNRRHEWHHVFSTIAAWLKKKINQYGARNEINFLRYVCRPFCSWTGFRRRSGQVPFSCWVVIFSFRLCRPCLELAVSIEISVWTWNEVANKPHR